MKSFQDLAESYSLKPAISKAITDMGYETPSPIQAETLPILLSEETDFLGLAATGTGKTAAFTIPLLQRIDPTKKHVQAIILCPTRELALQVAGQIDLLGKHMGVKALPIYGGAGYGDQISGLKRGAMIVVGTPGRIIDHMEKGTLNLSFVKTVILDEADEMISMGFAEDMEMILNGTPREDSNIWLFSATMSPEVRKVADKYLREPKQVKVNQKEMLSATVQQIYYATHESNKPEVLCKLIDAADDFFGIIFCQTKSLVCDLLQYLTERGYKVDSLHGDKDQNARERTMKSFRERKCTILICTDVASRGLDVKDVSHVINYSIPRELDSYVHRIGRTARSGKTGFAMSLVTPSHRGLISRIEKMTKSRMVEGKIPTRKEIGSKKVGGVLAKIQDQPNYQRAVDLMNTEWKTAIEAMPKEELAGRFLALLFKDLINEKDKAVTSAAGAPIAPRANVNPISFRENRSSGMNDSRGDRGGYSERRSEGGGYGRGRDDRGGGYGRDRDDRGGSRGGYGRDRDDRGARYGSRDDRGSSERRSVFSENRPERTPREIIAPRVEREEHAPREERAAVKVGFGSRPPREERAPREFKGFGSKPVHVRFPKNEFSPSAISAGAMDERPRRFGDRKKTVSAERRGPFDR